MNQNSYNPNPYGNGYGAPIPRQRNTPLIVALAILGIALLALAVLGGVMLGRSSADEASGPNTAEATEASSESTTLAEPSTVTLTQSVVQPAPTAGADIPTATTTTRTRTQAPATQNEQPSGPPSPPYAAGAGYEWFLKGPFQSTWTCTQNADSWPAGTSECFDYNGGTYYWAMRQASR